jgi:uncharacterized damage-inducible protein DinB
MNHELLTFMFEFTFQAVQMNMDGITHEDSLRAPPEGGNSMNWILGHIAISRDFLHTLLGLEPVGYDRMQTLYGRGAEKVSDDQLLNLDELRERIETSQDVLIEFFQSDDIQDSDFSQETLKNIVFLSEHEMYHAGQLGLLRRISGRSGAIE